MRKDFEFYDKQGRLYSDRDVIHRFGEVMRWWQGGVIAAEVEAELVTTVRRALTAMSTWGKLDACSPVLRQVPYGDAKVLASAITERDRIAYGVPEEGILPLVSNCLSAMGKAGDLEAIQTVQDKLNIVLGRMAMEKLKS